MLIGYVSDHRFVALPGVEVELIGPLGSTATTSRASGSVHADVPPGRYEIVLARDGYGAKRVTLDLPPKEPHQFRLLQDDLLGYVWPKWVRGGESSEFRVHSDAAYKLELFRYGFAKEFIRTIGWYDEHGPRATIQITPDGDYSQTGVTWNKFGYTSPHHKQFVAAPQRSGLYYFHAKSEAGRFFSFPWIVAPASPQAKVAVLASNITWNAYNSFGGRSNYIHPDKLPPTPTVNARLELNRYTNPEHVNYATADYAPLSFDRPEPICSIPGHVQATDPIEGRAACHVAEAEWRLLAWLEREGFSYDYYAETQLHFGQLNLDAYQVLIISTHPEYWSAQMFHRVKDWVFKRGGRLMYLGGNGLNCDVEFLDEQTCVYRNDDERRLLVADPVGNALRGVPARGKFESRFHLRHESEASLLGVVYDDRGIMTAAPYRVVDSRHWVFAGTGLCEGELFGQKSLHMRVPGGASGHETDKISPSSPANTHLLARGENPARGGAEMVIHEPLGGGAVFSAGSISWPASVLVDEAVSKITANVLRRFLE
jgi:N,N-dimethylformamidase beta subunit-like, C-terminal